MRKTIYLLLLVGVVVGCRKAIRIPMVQKYQVSAGDLFYFRGDQFVMIERRRALDIAVGPHSRVYSYPAKLTQSKQAERRPGEFLGAGGHPTEMWENKELMTTATPLQRLTFSSTGALLAGGAEDGSVFIWDLTTGNAPLGLAQPREITALAFSPGDKILAIGLGRQTVGTTMVVNPPMVRLVNYPSAIEAESFGLAPVSALTYAKDGRLLAGFENGEILIRPAAGGERRTLQFSTAAVAGIAVHPAGRSAAAGYRNKRIYIWNLETAVTLAVLSSDVPENLLFPVGIERLLFNESGTQLAAAYADGEVRIWDTTALKGEEQKP